jgi:hypothetical protein
MLLVIVGFLRRIELPIRNQKKRDRTAQALGQSSQQSIIARIDVEKSAYHQLSQSEIGSDNPCYQQLSNSDSVCQLVRVPSPVREEVA